MTRALEIQVRCHSS